MVDEEHMPHQTIFCKAGFVGVQSFFWSSEIAFMQPFHFVGSFHKFLIIIQMNKDVVGKHFILRLRK